jgi:hypothetical protein
MGRTLAIFGSCVTRDAFEIQQSRAADPDRIALYLSRTTINSCLSDPVKLREFSPAPEHTKFEERCVVSDLEKTHFRELRQAGFDYLLIDLIDERHASLKIGASNVCHSMPFARLAEARGIDIAKYERLLPNDPAAIERTVENIPRFLNRIQAIVDPSRVVLHEANWALNFRAADGTIQPFKHQGFIQANNRILDLYYDRMKAACPGMRTIKVPADCVLGDESHRWTLEPFHYADDYYAQFLRQLDSIMSGHAPGSRARGRRPAKRGAHDRAKTVSV